MLHALLIATATGLVTGLGVVPFFFRETIPRRVYDGVLGVGAGLMVSAATLGLLATALADVRAGGHLNSRVLVEVLLGFAVGVGLLALMERLRTSTPAVTRSTSRARTTRWIRSTRTSTSTPSACGRASSSAGR